MSVFPRMNYCVIPECERQIVKKETDAKGQVATNDDDDDHDVSREICTNRPRCSHNFPSYNYPVIFFPFSLP